LEVMEGRGGDLLEVRLEVGEAELAATPPLDLLCRPFIPST